MSSFNNPHHIYLFAMRNGKKKLSWGTNAEDAYGTLSLRLSPKELEQVVPDDYVKLNHQREMHQYLDQLG